MPIFSSQDGEYPTLGEILGTLYFVALAAVTIGAVVWGILAATGAI